MAEQAGRKLTRREFVEWSFGILAVAAAVETQRVLQRMDGTRSSVPSARSDIDATSLTLAQYLRTRPALSKGFALQPCPKGATLESAEGTLQLNESAHFVISRCDGEMTFGEISEALSQRYEVLKDTIQGDLMGFFNCLYGLGVMSFSLAYRLDREYGETPGESAWETIPA
jgi:hypothetical protein